MKFPTILSILSLTGATLAGDYSGGLYSENASLNLQAVAAISEPTLALKSPHVLEIASSMFFLLPLPSSQSFFL